MSIALDAHVGRHGAKIKQPDAECLEKGVIKPFLLTSRRPMSTCVSISLLVPLFYSRSKLSVERGVEKGRRDANQVLIHQHKQQICGLDFSREDKEKMPLSFSTK